MLVTHKLAEVTQVADRVTVIRAGEKMAEVERGEFDERTLTRAMTGREISAIKVDHTSLEDDADAVLEVSELVTTGVGGNSLDGLRLSVRAGEILGIAGVEGNGQRDVVNAITG